MKLIEIIKKNGMLLVAGLAVIGFSSFKMIEKLNPPQSGWYEVTPDSQDPLNESMQTIGSLIPAPPKNSDTECAETNTGNRCAIHLTFSEDVEEVPANVTTARADSEISVGADSKLP